MGDLRLLRAPEVAERLHIGVSTLWRWVKDGKLPAPRKFGATTVWSSEVIDNVIRDLFKEAA